MAAAELLCHFAGIDSKRLSKEENLFLEAELYSTIFNLLFDYYRSQYRNYFHLLNFNMENLFMELNFIRSLITDILKSEAYTLSGIAYYTQTPEEVVQELFISEKISPFLTFTRKLIELHKSIRPELYQNLIKKVLNIDSDSS